MLGFSCICYFTALLSHQLICCRAYPFVGTPSKITNATKNEDNVISRNPYLFVVSISINNYKNTLEEDTHICGGSLISRRHVLTAAHCKSKDYNPRPRLSDFNVKVGPDLRNPIARFNISKWQSFKRSWFLGGPEYVFNDISVITLSEDVYKKVKTFIEILDLNYSPVEQLYNKSVVTVGWGKGNSDVPSRFLKKVTLTTISDEECEENIDRAPQEKLNTNGEFRGYFIVEKNTLCTNADPAHPADPQNYLVLGEGDSGGPLLYRNEKNHRLQIIGVNEASAPDEYRHNNHYEQNLHVALAPYKKFIEGIREKRKCDDYRTPAATGRSR